MLPRAQQWFFASVLAYLLAIVATSAIALAVLIPKHQRAAVLLTAEAVASATDRSN